MKKVTLEATADCRPLNALFFTKEDVLELAPEWAQQMADCMNSKYLAHNIRGQHRATSKDGKFIRPEDHEYSVLDCLKGTTALRMGEPTEADTAEARKLVPPLKARVAGGESPNAALAGMVEYHAKQCHGWAFTWEERESLPLLDELGAYCRQYRLFVAKNSKAGGFR